MEAGTRLNLDIRIFSYELSDEVPIREIATIIESRRWTDSDALEHIISVTKANDIHIIIPFVDPATILISRAKVRLQNVFVPGASEKVCSLFYDKNEAQRWFETNGFTVPVFSGSFPAIAKPVFGSASNGVRVLHSQEETDLFFLRHSTTEFLLQRFVEGEEFSVDCYVQANGNIIAIVPRLRIQVAGGEVIKTRTVNDPELVSLSESTLKKSGLTGPACIQFIREKETGELFVMEVNPRFGGGVIASIEAGADMPYFLLNEYLGNKNNAVKNWQSGLLMMRAHREFFKAGRD